MNDIQSSLVQKQQVFSQLRVIKNTFAAKGWFPATSGNLSLRVGNHATDDSFTFAITASGKDKTLDTPDDFLLVDEQGHPVESTDLKPSAETLIHCEIYQATECGAVFHVHTVFNNLVAELFPDKATIPVQGIELIKAFNIWEENARIEIPVLPNYAEIPRVAALISSVINPRVPGILLKNHGIYAWGKDAGEAKKHLEAFEFLFEYLYYQHRLNS